MKVAEFAEKYGLPMTIVREASFATKTRIEKRVTDFPEDELFTAVKELLKDRLDRYREFVRKTEERLAKLNR